MKKINTTLIFAMLVCSVFNIKSNYALASDVPVLYFSDLVNGPKSGLGDGLGEGAIVTIWGVGFGASQGISKVYLTDSNNVTREAAYVYYWKNADGTLPGGPSNLYASHGMQEIAFSIPSAASDGAGKVFVEVDGRASNKLDFFVRSTGVIRFVKTGGTDSGAGTWPSPWGTVAYAVRGNTAGEGDIIYIASTIGYAGRIQYGASAQIDGSLNNNIALVAYPNARFTVNSASSSGISNYYTQNDWWVFSKLKVMAYSGTIGSSADGRTIGCEHTQPDGIEANGQSGAIGCTAGEYNARGTNSANNLKIFGNYIHNYGGQSTSNKEHATYFSLRNNFTAQAPEVAWNRLEDNGARFGIHIYDENECGAFSGTFKVHDNYIKNQVGAAVNIGTQDCSLNELGFRGTIEVYNNVIISPGLYSPVAAYGHGIMLYGKRNYMNVKLYNNTIYGYGDSPNTNNDVFVIWHEPGSVNNFDGTAELINNIFVDTRGYNYTPSAKERAPDTYSNNLWFSSNNAALPLPSWDLNALNADPLFTDPASGNFNLRPASPAINYGMSIGSVERDFFGVLRPQGSGCDIGAIEYTDGSKIPADTTPPGPPEGIIIK